MHHLQGKPVYCSDLHDTLHMTVDVLQRNSGIKAAEKKKWMFSGAYCVASSRKQINTITAPSVTLNFLHKYSNAHCISNLVILLLHREDRQRWLINVRYWLCITWVHQHCSRGLSLADPHLNAESGLGNQFLCLIYYTWTWLLTQTAQLLNSVLFIKVCYE